MWITNRALLARNCLATAAAALALSACAPGLGGGDEETATDAGDTSAVSVTGAPTDSSTSSTPSQLASADDGATDATMITDTVPAGDAAADVTGCTRIDEDTIEVELQNSLTESATYWLTVGFYDDANTRLGDTSVFINYVRPGERVIEQSYVFEEDAAGATNCQVLDTDRTADSHDQELLAAASACTITGEDFAGDVEGTVSVTNGGTDLSDFSITLAIVGADGVRYGTGNGYVEAVAAGETAPTDFFTTVPYADGQRCDVVSVERYDA